MISYKIVNINVANDECFFIHHWLYSFCSHTKVLLNNTAIL